MQEDLYGNWSVVSQGKLSLTADQLLFNKWQQIPLRRIHRINVISRGMNPLAYELLQVEYQDYTGTIQAATYAVHGGDQWAAAIQQHTNAQADHLTGRKKK